MAMPVYNFNICRTCESTDNLIPIDSTLSNTLKVHFSIQPLKEMNAICELCSHKIKDFEVFKNAAQIVDAKLHGILKTLKEQSISTKTNETAPLNFKTEIISNKNLVEQEEDLNIDDFLKPKIEQNLNKKNRVTCKICGKTIGTQKALKRHMLLVHAEKKFACLLCTKAYPSQRQLDEHNNVHTRKDLFICDFCEAVFVNIKYIREHMPMHFKYPQHTCKICNKGFKFPRYLKEHMAVKHNIGNKRQKNSSNEDKPKRLYQCQYCEKKIYTYCGFRLHVNRHEGKLSAYQCEFCGKSYSTKSIMERHVRHRHFDEKPFACEICPDRKFPTRAQLRRHMCTHSGKRPYQCQAEGCTQGHYDVNVLKKHMLKVHNMTYERKTDIPWSRKPID